MSINCYLPVVIIAVISLCDSLAAIDIATSNNKPSASSKSDPSNNNESKNLASNPTANPAFDDLLGSCDEYDYCSDPSGFEAIRRIHQRLDDDADGDVDITESDGFLRDELQYENAGERHRNFHGNDKHISVDELWRQWIISEVHNWTVDETCDWLSTSLELPEYVDIFQQKKINGTSLPRMANPAYISSLGIKDIKHKQKISLKAMDVVLFGPPQRHNYYKDIVLLLMCVIAIGGLWFALVQYKYSQTHLKKMLKDMDALQKAELQLQDLQRELDEARQVQELVSNEKMTLEEKLKNELSKLNGSELNLSKDGSVAGVGGLIYSGGSDSTRIAELEEELQKAREQIQRAESAVTNKSWVPPHQLQLWLQYTYELELQHYNAKRLAAEQQLLAAKEGCEKLKKKRSSFLGSFRVAHGSSIDDVDNRIIQAKAALTEITANLKERLRRWQQIEQLCGFQVVQNPGFLSLHTELYPPYAPNSISPNDPSNLTRNNSETAFHDTESDSFEYQKSTNLNRSALIYRPARNKPSDTSSTTSLPANHKTGSATNGPSNLNEESHSGSDSNDEDKPITMVAESENGVKFLNGTDHHPISRQHSQPINPICRKSSTTERPFLEKASKDVDLELATVCNGENDPPINGKPPCKASNKFPGLKRSGSVPTAKENSLEGAHRLMNSNFKVNNLGNLDESCSSNSDSSFKSLKKKESRKLSQFFGLRKRKSIPETNSDYFRSN